MPELILDRVTKRYGDIEAVRAVSFGIADGEFCAIVGPSGCGKSTALRLIAGLESVTEGTIAIGGHVVNDIDPGDRGIAMVFQDYALYSHMTVEENLSFGLRVASKPRQEVRERVERAANALELSELLDRKPTLLSGGERQGVAVGRSLVRNRKIFLFDEPLSNLDADLHAKARLEIARLHRERGFTAVYVTSDQREAMALADRIVVMRAGRVEQIGTPLELYENPDNRFVAGFFGSPAMNFLPVVTGEPRRDAVTVKLKGRKDWEMTVPTQHPELAPGTSLTLGIRPEHMVAAADASLGVEFEAHATEQLGGSSYIHGTSRHGEQIAVKQKGYSAAKAGDKLNFTFAPDKVRLFNEAGDRLR
ncbi:MAG: ATP-binding cassette domain-containing protein [Pseudomonadota bacterium]